MLLLKTAETARIRHVAVLLMEELMSVRCRILHSAAVLLSVCLAGCLSLPTANPRTAAPPAVQIPASQRDQMWERAIAVLHEMHFLVARESKLEGVIETEFRAGSSLLEPWNKDSVGYANRLESTLQSIRRRVTISFQETSPDYIMILVSVDKQIEDVPGLAANHEGGATFSESQPLQRDLDFRHLKQHNDGTRTRSGSS